MGQTGQPDFNNRHQTYALTEHDGRRAIVYRRRDDEDFPPEVVEAAQILRRAACRYMPRVYEVGTNRIVAEYLEGFVPLGKSGVTSAKWGAMYLRPRRDGRFRRWRLRPYLRDMVRHWDRFVEQMREIGAYMAEHGLWHDDVLPHNVMWELGRHELRLVDIGAMFPHRLIAAGTRLPFTARRTEGVFGIDYSMNESYLRAHFLQDAQPWWSVLIRKAGPGRLD